MPCGCRPSLASPDAPASEQAGLPWPLLRGPLAPAASTVLRAGRAARHQQSKLRTLQHGRLICVGAVTGVRSNN